MVDLKQTLRTLVKLGLEEDIGAGDVTSLACLEPSPCKAVIVAKSNGVLSGCRPAVVTFLTVDPAMHVELKKQDGDRFVSGDTIMEIHGFNQQLLSAERTALNFLGKLSGVATLTARFVELVSMTKCKILDTRKTTPGWRLLEKQAVKHGGGENHRQGLYDMVLIKDNHIAAAGSVAAAIKRTRQYETSGEFADQFGREMPFPEIEVEINNESLLREAIAAGVLRLLLDNQTTEQLQKLAELSHQLNSQVKLEASGNITLSNVAAVAATGVDYISIGALTHSAPAADFSLRIVDESID
jgi:nicotinate-nucleotide pyrophosphorylase (carboxylating)